jgi:hypothetical protein
VLEAMPVDWSDEETFDPLKADDRNFYKLEKWTRDGQGSRPHALCRQQPQASARNLRQGCGAPADHKINHPTADARVARVAALRR